LTDKRNKICARAECVVEEELAARVEQDRKNLRKGKQTGIWERKKDRLENSGELNRVRRVLAENDGAGFRSSWNDGT